MSVVPTEAQNPSLISVVIPAHNEATGISQAIAEISDILDSCQTCWEIVAVDDGSTDRTFQRICQLADDDSRIKGIRFSRNFGKESALLAGLRSASGEVVITIDADLQHPPRLIPELLQKWREGARLVHAVKRNRDSDGWIARTRAAVFNGLLVYVGGIEVRDSSDFKLLDRGVVNTIIHELPERGRFYRGLANWVGYTQVSIPFDVESRKHGEGKWSLTGLLGLALTAIISFSTTPLRIVTLLGLATLVIGAFIAGEALWSWGQGNAVSGFVTIIVTLLLVGSFIMVSLGIIGEYIAKIYEEIKGRPSYLIETSVGLNESTAYIGTRAHVGTHHSHSHE